MKQEFVEVRFHPIRKNHDLGRLTTFLAQRRSGETPFCAADRVLAQRYKVRDYLIRDARPMFRLH